MDEFSRETLAELRQENASLRKEIAERQRIEESLRASEALYRMVVENALQGILIHQDQRIVYANAASALMFGYNSVEALVGQPLWETLIAPDDWPVLKARTALLMRGERLPPHPGWRGVRKDGSTIWITANASLVSWHGQPAIAAFYTDITERKWAEEALRQSEERLRLAADAAGFGTYDRDPVANTRIWSANVRVIFSVSPDEPITDEMIRDRIHPDDRDRVVALQKNSYDPAGGGEFRSEHRLVHPSGSVRWVNVIGRAFFEGEGAQRQVVRSVGVAMDITDRKQAEEAMESSRRMLQIVLDTIPQGVFWKDRRSQYLGCNRIVAHAFGLERPEQIIGMDDSELPGLTKEQAAFFVQKDREVMDANTPQLGIIEPATLADGTSIWMETAKVPMLDAAGRVIGILGTWQDITGRVQAEEERRKLETQLQHTQKLESLGVLAGGIAHDFNNLLTSILGYADLALMDLPPESSTRQLIGKAVNGARRAAELTKQMLAYSGRGRFVVEPLNLSSLTEDMTRLLEISISKKCVLKYSLMPNLPSVEADAAQVRQIIMNLIINASDAIGDRSGVIAVTTGVMQCDRAYLAGTYVDENLPEGMYVYLEVADTGCGMSEETRARVFDPFFSTKFTGRGLGLSAVLGIVRGHRGAIKVYSEPGKGTTFKALFPATKLLAKVLEPHEPAAKLWRSSGTVLIVDDEDSVRALAQRMLEIMGFQVLTAADGQEGVAVFRENADSICLVLLDMTMPHLDGEETYREIRRIRGAVRAILSSGYNELSATNRFAGKGLAAFIQKPYRYVDLLAVVRQVMEKSSDSTES